MEDLTKIQIPLSAFQQNTSNSTKKSENKFIIPRKSMSYEPEEQIKEHSFKKKPGKKPQLAKKQLNSNSESLKETTRLINPIDRKKREKSGSYISTKAEYLKIKEKFKDEISNLGVETNDTNIPHSDLNSTLINLMIEKGSFISHDHSKLMKLVDAVINESLISKQDKVTFEQIRKKIISKKNDHLDQNVVLSKTLNQYYQMDFSNSKLLNIIEKICNTIDANYSGDNNIITIFASNDANLDNKSNLNVKDYENFNDPNSTSKDFLKNSKSYQQFVIEKMKLEGNKNIFSKLNDKDLFVSLIYIINKLNKHQGKVSYDTNKNIKDNDFFNFLSNNLDYFDNDVNNVNNEITEITYDNFKMSGLKPYTVKRFEYCLKKEFVSPLKPFKFIPKQLTNNLLMSNEVKTLIETILIHCVENKFENYDVLYKKISRRFDCGIEDIKNLIQIFKFFVSFDLMTKNKKYISDEEFWKIIVFYLKSVNKYELKSQNIQSRYRLQELSDKDLENNLSNSKMTEYVENLEESMKDLFSKKGLKFKNFENQDAGHNLLKRKKKRLSKSNENNSDDEIQIDIKDDENEDLLKKRYKLLKKESRKKRKLKEKMLSFNKTLIEDIKLGKAIFNVKNKEAAVSGRESNSTKIPEVKEKEILEETTTRIDPLSIKEIKKITIKRKKPVDINMTCFETMDVPFFSFNPEQTDILEKLNEVISKPNEPIEVNGNETENKLDLSVSKPPKETKVIRRRKRRTKEEIIESIKNNKERNPELIKKYKLIHLKEENKDFVEGMIEIGEGVEANKVVEINGGDEENNGVQDLEKNKEEDLIKRKRKRAGIKKKDPIEIYNENKKLEMDLNEVNIENPSSHLLRQDSGVNIFNNNVLDTIEIEQNADLILNNINESLQPVLAEAEKPGNQEKNPGFALQTEIQTLKKSTNNRKRKTNKSESAEIIESKDILDQLENNESENNKEAEINKESEVNDNKHNKDNSLKKKRPRKTNKKDLEHDEVKIFNPGNENNIKNNTTDTAKVYSNLNNIKNTYFVDNKGGSISMNFTDYQLESPEKVKKRRQRKKKPENNSLLADLNDLSEKIENITLNEEGNPNDLGKSKEKDNKPKQVRKRNRRVHEISFIIPSEIARVKPKRKKQTNNINKPEQTNQLDKNIIDDINKLILMNNIDPILTTNIPLVANILSNQNQILSTLNELNNDNI